MTTIGTIDFATAKAAYDEAMEELTLAYMGLPEANRARLTEKLTELNSEHEAAVASVIEAFDKANGLTDLRAKADAAEGLMETLNSGGT